MVSLNYGGRGRRAMLARPDSYYYCVYALAFHSEKEPISTKALIACSSKRRRRTETYFFHSQRNICCRRKVAWFLERSQFWFEHMVLNQYANNIWREHFRTFA